MFGGKKHAHVEERLDETFDSAIRKRRISGVREAEPEENHTRETIPVPLSALLNAEEHAAIDEARALYMQSQGLPAHELAELMELLGDVVEYGSFDPNAVPVPGMWSDLAELCLADRALVLLGLVDGERTIAEIVERSGLSVSDAVAELQVLVDHGALDV